jgi:hypothetical protein
MGLPYDGRFARSLCAVIVIMGTVAHSSPSRAVTFNFTYNAGVSSPPANDLSGTALVAMMQDAADIWSDIILDNWTINVELRWQVPTLGNNFSGQMQLFQAHPGNMNNEPAEQNNRAVWTVIRMNPNRNWWIDPTPQNNSEFNMGQTLYRDLTATQQNAWYNGTVPNLMEVGFQGAANAGAQILIDDNNARDLLTVAVHELGHTVGIGGTQAATNETNDGDYDIPSQLVGGANIDALIDSPGNNHINPSATGGSPVLMCVCGLGGGRRLPSAIDVFAGITSANWSNVRLPRIDFLTGSGWNTAGNWEGNRTPSNAVDTFVRHGGNVTLSAPGAAGNLLVDEGSLVSTQANTLFVQNTATVGGTAGPLSQITINTDGMLDADELIINDDGRVVLVSTAELLAEDITINAGGELRGYGTVDIDNAFGELVSNGTIRATNNSELVFMSANNLALNLDGTIEAIDGNIRFETAMSTPLAGTMRIGAGREVMLNDGGGVGDGGLILLQGTAADLATVSGLPLGVGLNGVVRADGVGVIENVLQLATGSILETQPGDPNSELRLAGTTFFQGGRILGDGSARQIGNAIVQQDSEIEIDTYDMDGVAGTTVITIDADRTLEVMSPKIDTTADNDFDGTIHVNSGTLDIKSAWRLDGRLNLHKTAVPNAVLRGAGGVTVDMGGEIHIMGEVDVQTSVQVNTGTIFVDGDAEFSGTTTLGTNAEVEINNADDSLRLMGQTHLLNPSLVGSGRLIFEGHVNVAFLDTIVGTAQTDLDGVDGTTEIVINQGLLFSIASTTLEPTANDGFDGVMTNRGTFSVLAGWRLDGDLEMDQIGATVPALNGVGPFRIHNTGTYSTDGDSIINPPLQVAGAMVIGAGVTQVTNTASFETTANVMVATGAELRLNGAANFAGGSYTGAGLIQFNAATAINANTTIATGRVDLDGAAENTQVSLNDAALVLNVMGVDAANSVFNGTLSATGANARLEVNLTDPLAAWRLGSGGILNFSTPAPAANPTLMLDGSSVTVEGRINATGRVQLGANIMLTGRIQTMTSATDVHFASGGLNLVYSVATIDGTGDITIDNGTQLNLHDNAIVAIDVENLGRLEVGFMPTEVGIDLTESGNATIGGNFSQSDAGTFGVELGGLVQANQFDVLNVTGTARLGGTLEVELIDGIIPDIGNMFQVLTAGSVIGTFDSVVAFDGADLFDVDVSVLYSATDVVVEIDDLALLGDYNQNGIVDAADYVLWHETLGQMGMDLAADGNENGQVDAADYGVWRAHFGNSAIPGAGAMVDSVAVPEPATCLLLVAALSPGFPRRRRIAFDDAMLAS